MLLHAVCGTGWLNRYNNSIRAGRYGDRFPVEALVRTGPGANPAPYTTGTGSFPGVKRAERGVDPPHLVPRLKKQ